MSKQVVNKILYHPDKDEIIAKLVLGISEKDINEWLSDKYSSLNENKFKISEANLKAFKEKYLDIYNTIREDLLKTQQMIKSNVEEDLSLAIKNNATYKNILIKTAENELDIKKMLATMIVAIETRAAQIFDEIQSDPKTINTRNDRILIEYFDSLGAAIEKHAKYVLNTPDQVIQHNVTVQHIDQHVHVLQDAIRETLADMDVETSLRFLEIFNEKMSRLKPPQEQKILPAEARLNEVKLLNEEINRKLSE